MNVTIGEKKLTIGEILPNDETILGVVLYYNQEGILTKVTSGFANSDDFRLSCHFIVPAHFVADKTTYVFFVMSED